MRLKILLSLVVLGIVCAHAQQYISMAVGTYTDAAKIAIQKMLGIYQAPWELICDETTTQDLEYFDVTTDTNGEPFSLIEAIIHMTIPVGANNGNGGISVYDTYNPAGRPYISIKNLFNNSANQIRCARLWIDGGRFFGEVTGETMTNEYTYTTMMSSKNALGLYELDALNIFRIYSLNNFIIPSGAKFTIYGRRKWT